MSESLARRGLAELFGTFWLVFGGCGSAIFAAKQITGDPHVGAFNIGIGYLGVALAFGLAACGMRGPLERPTGPAPEPLFGNPKPAPSTKAQPAKTGPDVSTDTPTAKP